MNANILLYPLMLMMGFIALSSCNKVERVILPEAELFAQSKSSGQPVSGNQPEANSLKIKITAGSRVITATLQDNPSSRDFLSRLPLDVTLNDYAAAEKIFYPSPALTTEGSPRGNASSRGDIDIYVPWGNIAIFYKNGGGFSNSIIHLGRIDGNGIEALDVKGSIPVRIEKYNR